MTSPDVRVPPIPDGTLCTLDGAVVRVYTRIWPGKLWDGVYECRYSEPHATGHATREQLQVIEVPRG